MKKLIAYYFRHRKLFRIFFALSVLALLFLIPHTVFAKEVAGEPAAGASKTITDTLAGIGDTVAKLLQICSMLLWPVLMMIGSLLDNELIFGGAMGERLLSVWVQIRNLVNILFVLILLAIAIYNILGLGEEGGSLPLAAKTALPKFVLALIAVNFSFLAVKVVLDFTNVVTGIVFALPSTTIERPANITDLVEQKMCGTNSMEVPGKARWCSEQKLTEEAKNFFGRFDRTNVTLVYAIKFGRAIDLKFIENGLKDIAQLTFNIIFNFILYAVYAVSFIVLFLVLLLRLVTLWVGVVLSPFLALGIVLPNLKQLLGGGDKMQETFVKNAIAPVKIGLVLSIGYIMLDGLQADKSLHGALLSSSTLTSIDPFSIPTSITDLQQLLIAFASVAIIWMGVFAGVEGSTAQILTNGIKGAVEGAGKWVAKLPMYAQVIPAGGGKSQTFAQMLDTLRFRKERFDRERSTSPERLADQSHLLSTLKQAAERKDHEGFAKGVHGDPTILQNEAAVRELQNLAQLSGDPLYSKLKNIDHKNTEAVTKAIRETPGVIRTAFEKAGSGNLGWLDQAKERRTAETARPPAGTPRGSVSPPSPPKPTTKEEAAQAMAKNTGGYTVGTNAKKVENELNRITKVNAQLAGSLITFDPQKTEIDIDVTNEAKIKAVDELITALRPLENLENIPEPSSGNPSPEFDRVIREVNARKAAIGDTSLIKNIIDATLKKTQQAHRDAIKAKV